VQFTCASISRRPIAWGHARGRGEPWQVSASTSPTDFRELRHAAGLSQEDVAHRAHCSVSYVRMLEGGYRPRTGQKVETIKTVIASALDDHDDHPVAA
jgi:predicted transcriptional regulator